MPQTPSSYRLFIWECLSISAPCARLVTQSFPHVGRLSFLAEGYAAQLQKMLLLVVGLGRLLVGVLGCLRGDLCGRLPG